MGRGGWGKGATPQPMAGPRGWDSHAAPPRVSGGGARGPEGPPHSPPPPPSGPGADGGRLKKRRPRTPLEEAAAPGVSGHHGRGRRPHALPAAGRRRTGGAQDGANGAAPFRGRSGKAGGANQGGGVAPPSPPPRRTDPLAADRTAPNARGRPATPTAQVYPAGARRRPRMAGRRPTGLGGGGAAPPHPPPCSPPQLGSHGSDPPPPLEPRGRRPLPQKGPRRGGRGCGWTCTPCAPAPPAACSRGGRGRQGSPHQRAGATRGPSLGAAHGGAPEQY